jgi:hypothetical protein
MMMMLSNWVMWFSYRTNNKIWNNSLNSWFSTSNLIKSYIDVCQMVGSLWWLSSNSKKTRSGFTTLSLCNQAGNTYFLSNDSWVLLKDFVKANDKKNESTRPTAADTIKNFPFHESLVWTKWFKTETLWRAYE